MTLMLTAKGSSGLSAEHLTSRYNDSVKPFTASGKSLRRIAKSCIVSASLDRGAQVCGGRPFQFVLGLSIYLIQ